MIQWRLRIKREKNKINILQWVLFVALIIYAVTMIYSLYWGFINSLKSERDFLINKNYFGLPATWEFSNFTHVMDHMFVPVNRGGTLIKVNMLGQIVYSLMYAVGCSFVGTVAPFLMAYAYTRFRYKSNGVIMNVMLVVIALPVIGSETSMLAVLHDMGLYDSFFGIFCVKFSYANLYFLIFISTLKSVSNSYTEAAYIDGANEMQILLKIIVPLIKNVFFTIMLIYFIMYWNDTNTVLVYLPGYPTFAYGVWYNVFVSTTPDMNKTTLKMTAAMFLIIPMIVVFMIFRKRLMTNLSTGGVKE